VSTVQDGGALRVALVELYGIGGTSDYTDCLARALQARGHDVTIVTSTLFEPLQHGDRVPSVPVFDYRPTQTKPMKALRLAAALTRARRTLRRMHPHVVHAQGTVMPAAEHLLYGSLGSSVRVCTVHDVEGHEHRPVLGSFRRFYGGFDGLICHSRQSMRRLEQLVPRVPVTTIAHPRYTPLTTPWERGRARAALGIPPRARVALLFGFIRPYKGLEVFLSAIGLASRRNPEVLGLVAGRPLYDISASRDRAEALNLPVRWDLRFIPRDEVARYFAAADVVALPYLDTSDSGLLELAAAFERPVVVSDTGGMAEAFGRYGVGAVVPPRDAEALAGAILADHAADGRTASSGTSWEAAAADTEDVYLRLLRRRGMESWATA
jgi:glycosyltransferase involved in cell wall biosynthesis